MSLSLNFVVNPSALNLDEEYGSFIKSFLSLSLVHGKNRSNLKKFLGTLHFNGTFPRERLNDS